MTTAALPTTGPSARPRARPSVSRLVLVPSAAADDRGDELIRRYRLARLRLEAREVRGDERFAHLKRSHD